MKAWVYRPHLDAETALRLEEVAIPRLGPRDLLLRVVKASVCGTDETLFARGLNRVDEGVIAGHELCGEIVEVGREVTELRVGGKVAVESHYRLPGAVDEGVIGLWPPRNSQGGTLDFYHGGYAQFTRIPVECAHPLPEELEEESFWPSLFEPAGNDFLLAREALSLGARTVAVVGCGPHGLYAQIFLRHLGIEHIVAFETDPERARFARDLGCATAVLDPTAADLLPRLEETTRGRLFDLSIDMVGKTGKAYQLCRKITREGGHIILFGLFTGQYRIAGTVANDLIFGRRKLPIEFEGKRMGLLGVTGREGVWPELIETVAASAPLRTLLMKPVSVIGPLDLLLNHLEHRSPDLLKAAFRAFEN